MRSGPIDVLKPLRASYAGVQPNRCLRNDGTHDAQKRQQLPCDVENVPLAAKVGPQLERKAVDVIQDHEMFSVFNASDTAP
jgi:hypothetical protein